MELQSTMMFLLNVILIEGTDIDVVYPCQNPVYCYGKLLSLVQTMEVFQDSKTFVDMPMIADPDIVLMEFDKWTNRSREGLFEFVNIWFTPSGTDLIDWSPTDWIERPNIIDNIENIQFQKWAMDLNRLWKDFGKQVSQSVQDFPDQHSLLSVDNPFIAPGGRFTEFYYWDSYWIIRGLLLCGMTDTAKGMILNLAQLIDQFGFVPNGGRVYYTMRSQPPLLTWMVSEYYQATKDSSLLQDVLPLLDEEYQFWMENRSVLYSGYIVNHYNSPVTHPRPESYREDLLVIANSSLSNAAHRSGVYSNLASGAESGWDYSSRWLLQPQDLSSIRTNNIIPVDLNAIIGINEILLERLHSILGSSDKADIYSQAWQERRENFDKLFWNDEQGLWFDRIIDTSDYLPGYYASSLTPLYMWMMANNSNNTQETIVLQTLTRLGVLNYPGGIPTSLNINSHQQWDFPNAWSPLQWFLVQAWFNSSNSVLQNAASQLATKWLQSNYAAWVKYNNTMFEKYDCTTFGEPGSGGEYNVQSGFGWSNAVILDFLNLYPKSIPSSSNSRRLDKTAIALLSTVLSVLVCLFLTLIPSVIWCRWLYIDGKRRYWARVRDEQMLHSSSSDPQSPAVFENPGAKEWSDSDNIEYQQIDI